MRKQTSRWPIAVFMALSGCLGWQSSAQAFTLVSTTVEVPLELDPTVFAEWDCATGHGPAPRVDTIWGVPCKIRVRVNDNDLFLSMQTQVSWNSTADESPRVMDATIRDAGSRQDRATALHGWSDRFALCISNRRSWRPQWAESDDREWLIHVKKDRLAQIIVDDSAAPPDPDTLILNY